MSETITEPPTSTAATQETEPEVVAVICSGEGSPELPTAFRIGTFEVSYGGLALLLAAGAALGYGGLALLLAAGAALGYGAMRLWQRR